MNKDKKHTKSSIFSFLKSSFSSAKNIFIHKLKTIFSKNCVDKKTFQDLEYLLLSSDFGVHATEKILLQFKRDIDRKNIFNSDLALSYFKKQLLNMLTPSRQPVAPNVSALPFVILVVGVNGVGKTTTIIKLAHYYNNLGQSVMLTAGDTFRAAAVEQLIELGVKHHIPVFSGSLGADSAAIVFDSWKESTKLKKNILIIDTAGRLHNKDHLLRELQKINRVITKCSPAAPHEIFLVLDASIGQNSIQQAKVFSSKMNITGIILTKLDSTAKGGVIFSIAHNLMIPIRYLSAGEKITDLEVFNSKRFVDNFVDI
ncbi:signal recognition particle-docking protein FtsY [Buchnera aphidicola]|uniref:signal recognition particle-docking protein FtsY n=1 Tax=Buchnera aphidicola TaxID=9 RepID=UPI001560E1DB|nr:signal recognition particle-docking protein FtsY [Buchnera aphidicola]